MIDPKLDWDECDAWMREDYRKEARAAIEAMRELSSAVLLNLNKYADHDVEFWHKAMIDAALAEK